MRSKRAPRLRAALLVALTLVTTATFNVTQAAPAMADPPCMTNGVYVLWLRGSDSRPWREEDSQPFQTKSFHDHVFYALEAAKPGVAKEWAEIGNLDRDYFVNDTEYPASLPPSYESSAEKGASELIAHLNDRYEGDGPRGNGPCHSEKVSLGGYSQGADAIGRALDRTGWGSLSQAAKNHIGYIALYGDTRNNAGDLNKRLAGQKEHWHRGDATGATVCYYSTIPYTCSAHGHMGRREPYVPTEFVGRVGSWCDDGDLLCNGKLGDGTHTTIYQNWWIWQSAFEVANVTLFGCKTLCPAQQASIGPSDQVAMYTSLNWSFRIKNVSNGAASVQRLIVAIRGPSGNALDVPCANGNGVTLQPGQEWTCDATLPQGFGQAGTYQVWPDWLDYSNPGQWHQGQLGPVKTFTVTQAPTLSIVQPISVGPSDYRPKLTPLNWSYRVKNTSGSHASIQRFVVAVRGPAGDALDVPCLNGNGVTLAPGQEWTCDAQLPSGYGSTGTFIFWPDWMDYQNPGQWHQGMLGASRTLRLY